MLSIREAIYSLKNSLDHLITPWLQNNGNPKRLLSTWCITLVQIANELLKKRFQFFWQPLVGLVMARGHLKYASRFRSHVSKVTGFSPWRHQGIFTKPLTTDQALNYSTLILSSHQGFCTLYYTVRIVFHPPSHQVVWSYSVCIRVAS